MKVLLVEPFYERKYPPLGLMKLSTWHKTKGDEVQYHQGESWFGINFKPDLVLITSLFTWDLNAVIETTLSFKHRFPKATIQVGGVGASAMPDYIEKHTGIRPHIGFLPEVDECVPDYSLFPKLEESMVFTCYDEKTEILTKEGWKKFKALTYDDFICTLNKDTEHIEYQKPEKIISYRYDGNLLHFNSKTIDLMVTPNHKMYVKKMNSKTFELINADEISKYYKYHFKKNGKWDGKELEYFEIPNVLSKDFKDTCKNNKYKIIDFLEFLGYYLSDGNTQYKKRIRAYVIKITQQKSSKNWVNIKKCLERMGLSFYIAPCGDFFISNKQLFTYLKKFGVSYEKYIPSEIKELSPKLLEILFDAYVSCDGVTYKRKNSETKGIISTSKKIIDDFQEILLKMGYCGNITIHSLKGYKTKIEGRDVIANHDCYNLFKNTMIEPIFSKQSCKVQNVNYTGEVFCCEVKNHILYVRRNGKPCWSGNSRGCAHKCQYCIVKTIEPVFSKVKHWEKAIDPQKPRIVVFDNNLLAADGKHVDGVFNTLERTEKWFDINSGFDVFLFKKKHADRIASLKIKPIRFAFDKMAQEKALVNAVQLCNEAGIKTDTIRVYVLYNYEDTIEEALYRAEKVIELGCKPFVMRFKQLDSEKQEYISPKWTDKDIKDFSQYYNMPVVWNQMTYDDFKDERNDFSRLRKELKIPEKQVDRTLF